MTVRKVTPAVAPILERFELDQPRVVTRADVDAARAGSTSSTTTDQAIRELTASGWLLRLRTRGVWEFAPAARAGAYSSGDPHIELRAALAKKPGLEAALAAESAAWAWGLSARPPTHHALAVPEGFRTPPALESYRIVRFEPALPPEERDGLPVLSVTSLVASMAIRPSSYRDWPNVTEWLPEAVPRIDAAGLAAELRCEARAAWMRASYLLWLGGDEAAAGELASEAPAGSGPFYFGPRTRPGRHVGRFQLVDSLLVKT